MTAKGLIITSLSPPAAWLPLAMSSRDTKQLSQSSSLVAVATVVSLATSPAVFYVVCQTQAPPPLYPTLLNIVTLVFPYRIGAKLRAKFNSETNLTCPDTSEVETQSSWRRLMDLKFIKTEMKPRDGVIKICALALVYIECSTQLYDAEGGLYISHVMSAFFGVLLYLSTSWWVAAASSRLFGEDRVNSAVFIMLAKGFSVGVVCS